MLRLVGVCAVALMLAACSSEPPPRESSVLEPMSEDSACDLISDAAVEKAAIKVAGKHGARFGRVESSLSYECNYDAGIPSLRTNLSTTNPADSDQEILDRTFTDMTKEWRPVGEYEEVPDLGDSARFGRNATLGEYADSWRLSVLFDVDGERLMLNLTVHGPGELDQLRPLAEEALSNLAG